MNTPASTTLADHAFDGLHRAVPHLITASKAVTHKVVLPVGLGLFSGAMSLIAMIVSPKRNAG